MRVILTDDVEDELFLMIYHNIYIYKYKIPVHLYFNSPVNYRNKLNKTLIKYSIDCSVNNAILIAKPL